MTNPKALITGAAGFAGSHLAELLLERGWKVAGFDRPGSGLDNLSHLIDRIDFSEVDLRDFEGVSRAVSSARPSTVFHLGAVSFLPHARHDPILLSDVNVKGTLHVILSCLELSPSPRMLLASSSEVYGQAASSIPFLGEESPLRPDNLYGWSKLCAEEAARFFHRSRGLEAVILRPFNHIGPRQSPLFVSADIARQLARIEMGRQEAVVAIGDLDSARDFTDVRDIARGYLLAAEKGRAGETYNLCSGRAVTVRELLDIFLARSGVRVEVRQETGRLREGEVKISRGDHGCFSALTGWEPKIPLPETLEDILQYWREKESLAQV